MTPKIEIHFIVTGSFDPDKFTKALGLKPTSIWRTGEAVQNTLIIRKTNGWKLSSDETKSHDLDVEIKNLISLLEPYKIEISNLCKKHDLNAEFSCVVTTENDEFPSMHFDKELLENIKAFDAEVDIDIY